MRPVRGDDELRRLSKHLAYEVEMVCWQAHYMAQALIDKVGKDLPHQAVPARNALVEAFTLHVRVVSDFLYRPKPRYPTDAVAWDYVSDSEPPRKGTLLKEVDQRVGPEIAHLSYTRNTIAEEAGKWKFWDIRTEVAAVLRELLPRMQDQHLHPLLRLASKPRWLSLRPERLSRSRPSARCRRAGCRARGNGRSPVMAEGRCSATG